MPEMNKMFTLQITPEQFLNACSINELQEVGLLLDGAIDRKRKEAGFELDQSTFDGDGL